MILEIPNVLTAEQVKLCREKLEAADWISGLATAGHQGARVKNNWQLDEKHPVAKEIGEVILEALAQNRLFQAGALPLNILPPMFNRYAEAEHFGVHTDGSIRINPHTGMKLRTDISCTLFFAEPDEYEGGELIIHDIGREKAVKLSAGSMVLYPSTTLHEVTPVTSGVRLCSFFWLQSLVRDEHRRSMMFDLDIAIQRLSLEVDPAHQGLIELTGVYQNLVRHWAEV